MKKIIIGASGIVAVLVGMGAIMPALAQVHHRGVLPASSVWPYTLGIVLVTVPLSCGLCRFLQKCAINSRQS